MRKSILAILLMAFALVAIADFPVSLITATERENGEPLGLSEIKGHNMYCGDVLGTYDDPPVFFAGATLPTTDIIITNVTIGTHYCVFTTVDIDERESVYSAGHKTLVHVGKYRPNPPLVRDEVIEQTTTIE